MQLSELAENAYTSLCVVAERVFPRILTQICRDEYSPFYGCADRNWWHYKIRDFPSIILQQSGATLNAAKDLSSFIEYREELEKLILASCKFWNKRALKFRSFEEYYPWEEGYPPLAFSTLSTARLVKKGIVNLDQVLLGFKVASKQLLCRFESEASNQQVAGLAALSVLYKICPNLVSLRELDALTEKTLSLQHPEGWFNEYGGPDLGYLSVTIDCLWDAFDSTADIRLLESAQKALVFLDNMTYHTGGTSIGMHNSRNTDYIVPYGITRFIDSEVESNIQKRALRVLKNVFSQSACNRHFFSSVDDRYWCHYIGLSVFRSISEFHKIAPYSSYNSNPNNINPCLSFSSSRYIWHSLSHKHAKILISTKKGGIFTIFSNNICMSDYGWIVQSRGKTFVSHWWSDDWNNKSNGDFCEVSGHLFSHSEIHSNPIYHFLLRIGSFFVGKRLISFLKKRLIFKKKQQTISFKRLITFSHDLVEVKDTFKDHPHDFVFYSAPRPSKRHVASADCFHIEDLALAKLKTERQVHKKGKNTIILTKYYI